MSRLRLALFAIVALFLTAHAFAANYAVGTCQPTLTSYATISQAVSSVPSGATIEVCPGNYPEQVVITQPLTLEGVPGASSDAVITVPAGGLTQSLSYDFVGIVTYQLLVQATGPVNITNLAVDGTGGAAARGYLAGIVYQDTSGNASRLSVRNQTGGELGIGLLALTSEATAQTVTVANSVFHGFDGLGMYVTSGDAGFGLLSATVQSNSINGNAGSNSVGVVYAFAGGILQSNLISDSTSGIILFSSSARVTSNTISSTVFGANIYSGSATFTNNKVDAGGSYGVYLQGPATNGQVENNTIGNSSTAVFGCDGGSGLGSASGFTVTGNAITGAAVGLEMPSGNTTTPNNYYITASALQSCP